MRRSVLFVLIAVVGAVFAVPLTPSSSTAAVTGITFTVVSTGDTDDATPDGVCGPPCTLREAMQEANANNNDALVDGISFAILGDGPHAISPTTVLPDIEEPVVIDGYTQGDSTVTTTDDAVENTLAYGTDAILKIVVDGFSITGQGLGFRIVGGDSTIRGLVINAFEEQSGLGFGINIFGDGNVVEGNFIGTNVTGTSAASNESNGVHLSGGAADNTIGGSAPAARNLISGNGLNGVTLDTLTATGNAVRGNLIGTQADGTSALSNAVHGIFINASLNDVTDNVIAFNTNGVFVDSGSGNLIASNSIFANTGQGIDLAGDARQQDRKDPDTGPNRLQNYAVVASAATSGTATTITGSLDSRPRKTFVLEFFANATPDGEGKTFLGQTTVRTNRKGRAFFAVRVGAVDVGEQITATATNRSTFDTSEFSDPVLVTPMP